MIAPERVAQMFAAIDDDGRRFVLVVLEDEVERVQKEPCPVLHLIQGTPLVATPSKVRAAARTKRKESA